MKRRNTPDGGTVSIEANGKTYEAEYTVSRGMVTVGGTTTQLGGSPADTLARMILREQIEGGNVTPID